jgi:hypothetical protein
MPIDRETRSLGLLNLLSGNRQGPWPGYQHIGEAPILFCNRSDVGLLWIQAQAIRGTFLKWCAEVLCTRPQGRGRGVTAEVGQGPVRLQDKVQQPLSGWFGHASPFAFEATFSPAPGIQRFLCGTPPIISLAALEVSPCTLASPTFLIPTGNAANSGPLSCMQSDVRHDARLPVLCSQGGWWIAIPLKHMLYLETGVVE